MPKAVESAAREITLKVKEFGEQNSRIRTF